MTHVLATTACGSLREEITPGLFLLPSSFIGKLKQSIAQAEVEQIQTGPLGGHSLSIPVMVCQECAIYPWNQVWLVSLMILEISNQSCSILSTVTCSGCRAGKSTWLSHLWGGDSGHHTGAQVNSSSSTSPLSGRHAHISTGFQAKQRATCSGYGELMLWTWPPYQRCNQSSECERCAPSFTLPTGCAGQGGRALLCCNCYANWLWLLERGAGRRCDSSHGGQITSY